MIIKNSTDFFRPSAYEETHDPDSGIILISLYLNTRDRSYAQIQTHIKSWVQRAERENAKLAKARLGRMIREEIFEQMRHIQRYSAGIAVFARVDVTRSKVETYYLNLPRSPEDDIFVGRVFSISQLIWATEDLANLLFFKFDRDICELYEYLEPGGLKLIKRYESDLVKDHETEHTAEYSPMQQKAGIVHGVDTLGWQKHEEAALKAFFKKIINRHRADINKESMYDYVVVHYSEAYNFMGDDIEEHMKRIASQDVLVQQQNLSDLDDIKASIKSPVAEKIKERKKYLYEEVQENVQLFDEGWTSITEHLRLGRVNRLFLKYGENKGGVYHG